MDENAEPAPFPEAEDTASEGPKRERSKIGFPYTDLDESVTVADALYKNAGASSAEMHQVAAWLGQTPTSGAFRTKVSGARTFGLIAVSQERVTLTPLGRRIVDPEATNAAKVESFLTVPLFGAIFDKYKGQQLPATVGLEREITELGVSVKQKERARQTFQKSARQAGFFAQGPHKLVLPAFAASAPSLPQDGLGPVIQEPNPYGGNGGGSGGGQPPRDTLIDGLIGLLPKRGSVWAQKDREEWINAWKAVLPLMYRDAPGKEPPAERD